MLTGLSADGAGPVTTEPLAMLNSLPWHRQSTVPPDTLETVEPWWVDTRWTPGRAARRLGDDDLLVGQDLGATDGDVRGQGE